MHAATPVTVLPLDEDSIKKRVDRLKQALSMAETRGTPVVCVINYDAVWRDDMAKLITRTTWQCLILDEAHRIKRPDGRASLFLGLLSDRIPYRLALTGTPMPHGPLDIYALYRALDKTIFGTSFVLFRAQYAMLEQQEHRVRGKDGQYRVVKHPTVTGYKNLDDLHEKMYRIAYRVLAKDVLDLPQERDVTLPIRLSALELRTYQQLSRQFQSDIGDGAVTPSNALVRVLRLQQVTSGFVMNDDHRHVDLGTSKFDMLLDWLEDLPDTEPVVVFCRFRYDLERVRTMALLLKRSYAELSGQTNELNVWQKGSSTVLGVQIQSGGVGIDLTRACVAVFFSLGFSLGDYLQARARLHRPGQTRPTLFVHLVATQTIDEQVYNALAARSDVIDHILAQYRKE